MNRSNTADRVALGLCLAVIFVAASPALVAAALGASSLGAGRGLAAAVLGLAVLVLWSSRLWPGLVLLTPWMLLAPLESWYLVQFGRPSDVHLLGVIAETDAQEASAYLAGLAMPMALVLAASLMLSVAAIWATRRTGLGWRHRWRPAIWAVSVLLLLLPWLAGDLGAEPPPDAPPRAEGDGLVRQALDPVSGELADAWPVGLPLRVWAYLRERGERYALSDAVQSFRFGARERPEFAAVQREVHVLVIGETGRPDRWQLNGYGRPTTPRLMTQQGIVSFTNMISPWAWTRMSVPLILTRKPPQDPRPFFAERSLLTAFHEAGYRTYWLSTQSPMGPYDSTISLHAREADVLRYVNPGSYKTRAAYDGDLLGPLREALSRPEPRQLIVLHTLGSHFDYGHRYPQEFEIFRPSTRDVEQPSLHDRAQREALSNAYDNSVAYTDDFLAEVIQALRNSGAVSTLFYVADHGENLFDGECTLSGHGHGTERDFRAAALFWHDLGYAALRPELVARAVQQADAPMSTAQVFHTMLDVAGIDYPGQPAEASLFSPSWKPSPRIVQGGLDFDRALREPMCLKLKSPRRSAS